MALKQAGLIFRAEAASSLVITPRSGEAFRVRKIFVTQPSTGTNFLTVINDTARVGFFRTNGYGGKHLIGPNTINRGDNLLEWMNQYLSFAGYPVVQGESLTLSMSVGTADIFAIADAYDAGDVKSTEVNGSKSQEVLFINYGTNGSVINTATYTKLDTSLNPSEMVRFPFGAIGSGLVPAQRKIVVHFLGGQSVGRFVSAGNTMNTQFLRLKKGAPPYETLFDRASVGYPFLGTVPGSAGADYTSERQALASSEANGAQRGLRTQDDILPDLNFGPNDEFIIEVSTQLAGTGQLNAQDVDVWALMRIMPA